MREELLEGVKLTANELFWSLFDIPVATFKAFDAKMFYKRSIDQYFAERSMDRENFRKNLYELKRRGLIKAFLEGNERFAELTEKGKKTFEKMQFEDLKIVQPGRWDKKIRLIIFDVPEDKRSTRDAIRRKLEELDFMQIQKSVYAYPFECKTEIEYISRMLGGNRFLKYMVVEILEGEDDILSNFLSKGILTPTDLK